MPRPFVIAADDDEGWRDLLERWLSAEDFCDVKVVDCGKAVLPAAARRKPDLFILDHQLGDTTGLAICAAIKKDKRLRDVPVIILTTMAGEMLKIVADARPDHFVVKSDKPDELLDVVERVLPKA